MTREEARNILGEGYDDAYLNGFMRANDDFENKVKLTSDECQLLAMYAEHHGQDAIYIKLCTMMYQDLRKVND